MIGLEILTSKGGKLWPSEYYKTLIDFLTIGGAIANPIEKYPEFVKVIEERLEA